MAQQTSYKEIQEIKTYKELKSQSVTTRIAGGLISPKRALLLAPLKGIPDNFSMIITRCVV